MTARPWVLPQEVRDYSDYNDVAERNDAKLAFDISRAEQAVIAYTNNKFDDEDMIALPGPVRQAIILIAERYAHNAYLDKSQYQSETLDDWSYTSKGATNALDDLGLAALLDDYKEALAKGGVMLRMRKL